MLTTFSPEINISLIMIPKPLIPVKSESEVAQSCLNLCDPMDCSLRGSSIHGIIQARVLELVAIFFPGDAQWYRWNQSDEEFKREKWIIYGVLK